VTKQSASSTSLTGAASPAPARLPGWDVLAVALLTLAQLQITGLAEAAALPNRVADVLRHPWLGTLLSPAGIAAMGEVGPRPGDPLGLLLVAFTITFLLLYALVDWGWQGAPALRWKGVLLGGILATALFLPAGKLILLRADNGPASYSHDGGVIQTEAAIRFFLAGQNPYVEDYTATPMAEWGFSEYRTALYHYPYLPWTFVFSAPFYLVGQALGGYDQRLIYLALMALLLWLAPRLVENGRSKLALVALLGLNPIMGLDLIFGQNDSFVLCWLFFSLAAWRQWQHVCRRDGPAAGRRWWLLSTILFGLACASKPTAWFFAPFYGLLLLWDQPHVARDGLRALPALASLLWKRVWPAVVIFVLLIGPYLLWDAEAFIDDVWRWSSGQGPTGYQIWGWGASNFVLALGWVADRFSPWPFWIPQLLISVPLLLWLTARQCRHNTLALACWHGGLFLFGFFYASRFLNENYLGYIAALLILGYVVSANNDE
jgi:hypothetical protein